MTYTSHSMFTVPLTSKAYKLANSFQTQYENPAKARQVYLNTLAVYAVDAYCQCLGIETDIESCESLNSVTQPLMDIADLEIEGIGKLECCPVLPQDKDCYIPADTWENRIGYVAVEIDESSREATLLGFYPPINALEMMEQVSLDDFQPLETFLDHLNRIESALDFFYSDDPVAVKARKRLTDQVFSEFIAQIERIYRTCDREEWRYAGGGVLAGCVTNDDRELLDDSQQLEVQELAEELLEKLDEIWRDEAFTAPELDISVARDTQKLSNTNALPSESISETVGKAIANLSQWFQSILDAGWETFDFLVNSQENLGLRLATATRSSRNQSDQTVNSVKAGKFINLGGENAENIVVLINDIQLETDQQTRDILLQVHPTGKDPYLPKGLQLIVLDESGDIFLEAQARSHDNWIQLNFRGQPGEHFSVKVALGDRCFTEDFVI